MTPWSRTLRLDVWPTGFDANVMLLEADVVEGSKVEHAIGRMFANPCVASLHLHNAKRGCYAARVDRA